MVNWEILGIAPTNDISTIKKAYRAKLADTNPEDKPEEFMELRRSYEEAVELAKRPDEDAESADEDGQKEEYFQTLLPPEHPAFSWFQQARRLYRDFYRRIVPENWSRLAADPVCSRIDTAADARNALLSFFMEYWFLPDEVIRTLDSSFHFRENQEELMENYPREFVEAILLAPLEDRVSFEYDLFRGPSDKDYDSFIRLYYHLCDLVNEGEWDEAERCLSAIEATDIFHPYINVEKAKIHLSKNQLDLAEEDMAQVADLFPDSPNICCMAGEVALVKEDYDTAQQHFSRAYELAPSSRWAKLGLGETLLATQDYEAASDWINQVLAEDRYSPRGKALQQQIEQAMKEQLTGKWEAGDTTADEKIQLAIFHIDNGESRQAQQILQSYQSEDPAEEADRLHFLATAELELDDYPKAHDHFRQAENCFRRLLEVTAEEDRKREIQSKTCRSMIMDSVVLQSMGRLKDGLEVVTNAVIDFPNQPMALCRKAELHGEMGMYQDAIEAASQSIELDDSFHLPFRIRANAYYETGYYNEAYEDCNRCIEIYSGDLEVFLIKISILIEVAETDSALAELDSLEEQVEGSRLTFLRGRALEAAGELEKAKEQYQKVLEMVSLEDREVFPPAEVDDLAETYYHLYNICRERYESSYEEPLWAECVNYLETGHQKYPDDIILLSELAGVYFADRRYQEAQVLYEAMVRFDPSARHYAQRAGNELHLDMFREAEQDLQKAGELDPDLTYVEILKGVLHTDTENYREAIAHYKRAARLAEKKEENWYRIYQDMADTYCRMKDYNSAIHCLRENFDLYQQEEDIATLLEIYRLEGRFEEAYQLGDRYLEEHPEEGHYDILTGLLECAEAEMNHERFSLYGKQLHSNYYLGYQTGRFLMYQGKPKEALNAFQMAEEDDNRSINTYIMMAKLFLLLKNKKEARKYASMVYDAIPENYQQIGSSRSFYTVRAAEALTILGDTQRAEEMLKNAIPARKCNNCRYCQCIDAYCALVYLYCILGDEQKAREYLEKGKEVSPFDYDLQHTINTFMKKRGLFK